MTSTKTETPSQRATKPSRARGWVLAACVVVAVAIVAIIVATTMNVGSISIVDGWFPVLLFWLTIAVCVIAVVVLRKDVLQEFLIGIPIGIGFAVALFGGCTSPGRSRRARPGPCTCGWSWRA